MAVGNLLIATGGTVNVNSSLLIDYAPAGYSSPEALIQNFIESGAILSTTAAGNANYGIAYADGSDSGVSDPNLTSGMLIIEPDLIGDADLNGEVNFHDLQNLLGGFGNPGFWDQGNFNGHATVDFNDLQMLLGNFGDSTTLSYSELNGIENLVGEFGYSAVANSDGTGFTLVSVPEPGSGILLVSACALLSRKRRPRIDTNPGE